MQTVVLAISQGKQARNDINLFGGKMFWDFIFGLGLLRFIMFKLKVDKNFWEISQADIPVPRYIHLISLNKKREGKGVGDGLVSPQAIYAPFPFKLFFSFLILSYLISQERKKKQQFMLVN